MRARRSAARGCKIWPRMEERASASRDLTVVSKYAREAVEGKFLLLLFFGGLPVRGAAALLLELL